MDNRAVSVVVNYVIVLAIVTLLGSGLFVAAGDFVETEREVAIRAQLDVVGNDLAADLASVDRQARAIEEDGSIQVTVALPERIAGSGYWITISHVADDRYRLGLRSTDPAVEVHVFARSRTGIDPTTVRGGPLRLNATVNDGVADPVVVADG